MVLFKDLNKVAKDALTRDYVHDKACQTEVKHKGKDHPTLTLKANNDSPKTGRTGTDPFDATCKVESLKLTKDIDLEFNAGVNGSGSLLLKYHCPTIFLTRMTKLISFDEADVSNSVPCDLTFGVLGNKSIHREVIRSNTEVSIEAVLPRLHTRFESNPESQTFSTSMLYQLPMQNVFGQTKIFVGGESSGHINKRESLTGAWGIQATRKMNNMEYSGSIRSDWRMNKVVAQLLSRKHEVKGGDDSSSSKEGGAFFKDLVAEVIHTPKDGKSTLSFGTQFDVDKDNFIKAKITHDRNLAVAYSHKATKYLTMTMGAEISRDMTARTGVKFDLTG